MVVGKESAFWYYVKYCAIFGDFASVTSLQNVSINRCILLMHGYVLPHSIVTLSALHIRHNWVKSPHRGYLKLTATFKWCCCSKHLAIFIGKFRWGKWMVSRAYYLYYHESYIHIVVKIIRGYLNLNSLWMESPPKIVWVWVGFF